LIQGLPGLVSQRVDVKWDEDCSLGLRSLRIRFRGLIFCLVEIHFAMRKCRKTRLGSWFIKRYVAV
jgi:hypothetical protein